MNLKQLISFIFYTLILGFLGSIFVNKESYNLLIKPDFAPPPIVFGIAWTILYILMGISFYYIYNSSDKEKRKKAIKLYILQLLVNISWPFIFFKLGYLYVSFIWLLILLILVIIMTIKFSKIDKKAALLQIPYIAWLIFAGILNLSIYVLNS